MKRLRKEEEIKDETLRNYGRRRTTLRKKKEETKEYGRDYKKQQEETKEGGRY